MTPEEWELFLGDQAASYAVRAQVCGDHPLVGDIRGRGLMVGVELVADKKTKASLPPKARAAPRVMRACLERGLVLRGLPGGTTLAFSPPLCISTAEIEDVVQRFRGALDDIAAELGVS